MKLSRLFNNLPKRIAASALVALAFAFPVAASAADMVKIEANTGVANVTAGDTDYSSAVDASYNQVVKVTVVYNNKEDAGSGKVAQNLRVKVNIPTTAGKVQNITTTTKADNSNTVNGSAVVNLNRADAYLQFIPGSAVWKHLDAQTNTITTKNISDSIVTDANGLVLENENPCQAGAIAVKAIVRIPGVNLVKQVRVKGTTAWSTSIKDVAPGSTVQYRLVYTNTGNTTENQVVVRDNLPPKMVLVPGTTYLKNGTNPNGDGVLYASDAVTSNGIVIGDYSGGIGANAQVMFDVTLPLAKDLACGDTLFRNVGIAKPQGMSEYFNTADVKTNKVCTTPTAAYSCDAFHVTVLANKTVKVDNFKTTATNGATFKNAVINWGDQSTPLTTNTVVGQTYQYQANGPFTLSATAHFTLNGKDVSATNNCTQTVSFTTPTTPTPPVTPPTELPNTGAGNVFGIFAAAVAVGTIGYRLFLSRKLTR